ncbi:MAG: HIT family protein [Rickettsiales bacterium]|nr:HIT family protein [Pseudomonadota bacterium]MDA0966538.1 HIT family protein [Pseudomonadota bacterium]MDG4543400.1 HIT family protein [Rickettsiales bacterium]MDG4546642.1 HIT family protein [Rickettsiales bacterium]MDG4548115.1 HIT family protein [Rickettsiales bacterium]
MTRNYEQIFFYLNAKLEENTFFIGEFPLCGVLLMNNKLYPWIILVPKCENAIEITDISSQQRAQFMEEIAQAEEAMRNTYWPDKMNIASMGNHVEQLHMHIIARFKTDDIWPQPVWGTQTEPYNDCSKEETIAILRKEFNKLNDFHTVANN